MKIKLVRIGILAVLATAVVAGTYFLAKRMLHDRAAAMAYREHPVRPLSAPPSGTHTVKTYNSKDLEEAKKNGDQNTPSPVTPTQPNTMNDAVQRNLRTLDEINRINQMNQRMMEQQDRMRRQNKN